MVPTGQNKTFPWIFKSLICDDQVVFICRYWLFVVIVCYAKYRAGKLNQLLIIYLSIRPVVGVKSLLNQGSPFEFCSFHFLVGSYKVSEHHNVVVVVCTITKKVSLRLSQTLLSFWKAIFFFPSNG